MIEPGTGRIVGVLGGMGPLASAHFMLRLTALTPATIEQDHVPAILWSDPRIPERMAGRNGTGPDPLPWMVHGLQGLERAGCGAIVIPCNTAHAWIDPMRAATRLPILHIVTATANSLRQHCTPPGPIGILGTELTLAMRLYQDPLEALGWQCLIPDAAEMTALVKPGIAAVKANRLADSYAPLAEAVTRLRDRGARAIVLGCTEIPIGLQAGPAPTLGIPLIDTIDALALEAIAWARGTVGAPETKLPPEAVG